MKPWAIIAATLSMAVTIIGASNLFGYIVRHPDKFSWPMSGYTPMAANAALCFTLLGFAVFVQSLARGSKV